MGSLRVYTCQRGDAGKVILRERNNYPTAIVDRRENRREEAEACSDDNKDRCRNLASRYQYSQHNGRDCRCRGTSSKHDNGHVRNVVIHPDVDGRVRIVNRVREIVLATARTLDRNATRATAEASRIGIGERATDVF